MAIVASMLGWALGFGLSALTRTEKGAALYLPIPSALQRVFRK